MDGCLKDGYCHLYHRSRVKHQMRGIDNRQLILIYLGLAVSCALLGVGITFIVLVVAGYYGIDVTQHLWLLAVPAILSLLLNCTSGFGAGNVPN
jgi:hypothetical protein